MALWDGESDLRLGMTGRSCAPEKLSSKISRFVRRGGGGETSTIVQRRVGSDRHCLCTLLGGATRDLTKKREKLMLRE